MRIIGRDAPAVKLDLNFKAAFLRKRLRYHIHYYKSFDCPECPLLEYLLGSILAYSIRDLYA